jgi:hypothetical protein
MHFDEISRALRELSPRHKLSERRCSTQDFERVAKCLLMAVSKLEVQLNHLGIVISLRSIIVLQHEFNGDTKTDAVYKREHGQQTEVTQYPTVAQAVN